VASNEEILELTIGGIPRVAKKIAGLSADQKARAFEAVRRTYLRTVLELDYAEDDARHWVAVVMDTLRAEVADHDGLRSAHENLEPIE
jgi:hypothetical protein